MKPAAKVAVTVAILGLLLTTDGLLIWQLCRNLHNPIPFGSAAVLSLAVNLYLLARMGIVRFLWRTPTMILLAWVIFSFLFMWEGLQ